MATTINSIKVDFGLGAIPPRITFLQGADMNIPNIRDTLRQLEESEEGRMHPGAMAKNRTVKGWIVRAGGNFEFSDIEKSAMVLEICRPFALKFEGGPIPFSTELGSLLGDFVSSPGAVIRINNSIGSTVITVNSDDIDDLIRMCTNRVDFDETTEIATIYESDGLTIWRRYDLSNGSRIQI